MLVDDFRRDVLAIAKATESAVDFDDVIRIRASALGYVEKLEGYFSVFQKNHPNVDVKPLWQLVSHLRSVPLHSYDGWSKEHRFSLFQEKSQGWSRTLRAKAVAAWKVLKPLPESKLPKDENVVVSGFKCIFRGYESEGKSVSASYEFLERALDQYREKASKVFPVILRRQVPFLVDWTWGSNLGTNVAATYEGSHIILSPWVLSGRDPLKTVQMLAHEMGHHLFRTHLSDDDKSFWNSAIQSNREDVNLLDVVQTMTSKGYSYLEDMIEEFPELYIQMSTLEYSDYPDMWSLKKIQEYLNSGGNPIVRAPSIPITAYASKNTEEAFCEALGMSVAYGGRTVHPLVKKWLGVILGSQLRVSFNKKVKGMSKKFSPHEKSIALMKFLSNVARKEGVSESVYVVGGAVRNFLMKVPIKDIDVVIDSVALGGKDSAWFANALAKAIPTQTSLVTNTYGVAILTVKGSWILDGQDLQGEVIEIANARKESYDGVGGKGKGYKPSDVVPATIEEDVNRREFRFNTLLWKMRDLVDGPENAEVIDLTGFGRSDLDKKLMNTPVDPDKTFGDDPTRILRAVKFFLRYDMEIPPEVASAMRRNAPKMKTMPWEAVATILVVDILDSPKAMKALPFMKSLGLLDVIVEMVSTIPAFATYLSRHLANSGSHSVELLLELADIGIAGRVLQFLTPPQRQKFKDITSKMEPEKAREFLGKLQAPPVNSEDLIQEFKLEGRDRGTLVPMARELILEDQSLAFDRPELNQAMRFRLNGSRSRSAASKYEGIDFTPPKAVQNAAKKGLEYRQKASPSNKGGLTPSEASKEGIGSGVQRAVNLKNGDKVSPEVIGQMVSFFARHRKNKSVSSENKSTPWNDKGYVSWLLWGGDPGDSWSKSVKEKMDANSRQARGGVMDMNRVAVKSVLASKRLGGSDPLDVIGQDVLSKTNPRKGVHVVGYTSQQDYRVQEINWETGEELPGPSKLISLNDFRSQYDINHAWPHGLMGESRVARFPKGVSMTVDEVADVVGPEFKEMNEDPPESVIKVREEMEKKASRGTYVPTKDLPKLIVDELKQIGFNKKDIQVIPTTSFRPQGLSGDGTRAFITLISLIDGRTKTEMGSWGGANMFVSKQVDVDDRERPLPRDFAVIKGTTGGYVFAELLVHPDNLAKFLPSGESVELTDKEKLALKAIATLTSSGRKDAFGYNRLGQYRPENPLIQSLITKGLVKSVGAGISITTDGKNVASGLPQIY